MRFNTAFLALVLLSDFQIFSNAQKTGYRRNIVPANEGVNRETGSLEKSAEALKSFLQSRLISKAAIGVQSEALEQQLDRMRREIWNATTMISKGVQDQLLNWEVQRVQSLRQAHVKQIRGIIQSMISENMIDYFKKVNEEPEEGRKHSSGYNRNVFSRVRKVFDATRGGFTEFSELVIEKMPSSSKGLLTQWHVLSLESFDNLTSVYRRAESW
jgi:hypothetical protein